MLTSREGKVRKRTVSYDSYQGIAHDHAVLPAKKRKLISRLGAVDESLIDHVRAGGGAIVGGVDDRDSVAGVTALLFDVDMLLFADGEIVGLILARLHWNCTAVSVRQNSWQSKFDWQKQKAEMLVRCFQPSR